MAAMLAAMLHSVVSSAATALEQPAVVIPSNPGSEIKYIRVDGTSSPGEGMIKVLGQIKKVCGEKPSISRPLRVRNGDSVVVFYQVVNHAQNGRRLQGMLIGTQTGPSEVEVASVTDQAERFAQTMNPMLERLYAAWHPALIKSSPAAAPAVASASSSRLTEKMTAPDDSASISVPGGWTMDPGSGHGAIGVHGPNGETIFMGMARPAVDPSNRWQAQMARQRISVAVAGSVLYPFHGDIGRDYPGLMQAWRRAAGQPPLRSIEVQEVQPVQAAQANHCAIVKGTADVDGRGTYFFSDLMCASDPNPQFGNYGTILNRTLVPSPLADKERPMMKAIVASFAQNAEVVNRQMAQMVQAKQAADAKTMQDANAAVARIHQIGQMATQRQQAADAQHEIQHAEYWSKQDAMERRSKEFSDYLLDQRVVQNNDIYGNGSGYVGHATLSNSLADALVKANPDRFEYVDKPGYWPGTDIP